MIFRKFSALVVFVLFVLIQTPSLALAENKKDHARIFGSTYGGDGWSEGLRTRPMMVDGKLKETLFGRPVKVPAGEHVIGIAVSFDIKPKNPLFEPMPKYADMFEFTVTLLPSRSYKAKGKQNGTFVEVWIEDESTRETVSEIIEIEVFPCKKLFKKCPPAKINRRAQLY
jgi:hypothetical protein